VEKTDKPYNTEVGRMKYKIEIVMHSFPVISNYGLFGLSNIYLIRKGKTNILFDTGGFGQRRAFLLKLKEMGYSPAEIEHLIISHTHWDHIMNVPFFSNAKTYVHQEDMKFAHSKAGEADLSYPLPYMRELLDKPNLKVWDAEEIVVEGIRLIHTPGHTPGSVSAVMETSWGTTVICGDHFKNRAEFWSKSYDIRGEEKVFMKSVEKILALKPDAIAPGHDLPFDVKSGKYLVEQNEGMLITGTFYRDISKKSHFLCQRPPDSM
jgi:N-acyl homoserine lactone hydrolase